MLLRVVALVALLLLGGVVEALHTSGENGERQHRYVTALVERETKLRADLDNLKATIEMLRSKLSSRVAASGQKQLELLQETLAEQRDTLHRIESYLGLPFSMSACQCLNVSAKTKAEIRQSIGKMEQQLAGLHSKLEHCHECPRVLQLRQQAEKQSLYVKEIKQIVAADCCGRVREEVTVVAPIIKKPIGLVNLNTSIFVSNLDHVDWIYGNTTEKEMKLTMFAIASKHNTTKCKPGEPIAISDKKCMSCPKNKPIWNVGLAICAVCPTGHLFNRTAHACSPIPVHPRVRKFNSRPDLQNYVGTQPVRDSKLPDCPKNSAYSATDKCVHCQLPNYFNYDTEKCASCPAGEAYDLNLHKCHKIEGGWVSDLYQHKNWITVRQHIEVYNDLANNISQRHYNKCPSDTPYYDQITCVPCSPPKIFDLDRQLCRIVPKDKMFDENMHELLPKDERAFNTRPNSSNLLIPKPQLKPQAHNDLCSPQRPYYDGVACVLCQQPFPLFNVQSLKCERCKSGHIFHPQHHSCEKSQTQFYTDLSAPNLLLTTTSLDEHTAQQNKWKKQNVFPTEKCPSDKPFYNDKHCISCSQPTQLFNIQTKQCSKCEAGDTYNPQASRCYKDVYYSNVEASNVLVSPNYGVKQYQAEIDKLKQNNPGASITMCPDPGRPFLVDGACNFCPSSAPLYDLATKKCTQCDTDRDYEPQSKTCKWYERITSPKAPNLFLQGGRIEQYEKEYADSKAAKPQLRDCPLSAPYHNGHTCVSCAPTTPLFDIIAKKCIKCLGDTRFDQASRSCVAAGRVETSLQRLIMNT